MGAKEGRAKGEERRLTLILRSRQLAQALLGSPLKAITVAVGPSTGVLVSSVGRLTTAQEQMRQVHRESRRHIWAA
jgi:hypothetical protein